MNIRTFSRNPARLLVLLAALVVLPASVLLADPEPKPSAPAPYPVASASLSSAQSTVVVKIGDASLEEYQHGDPANRIQLLRGK